MGSMMTACASGEVGNILNPPTPSRTPIKRGTPRNTATPWPTRTSTITPTQTITPTPTYTATTTLVPEVELFDLNISVSDGVYFQGFVLLGKMRNTTNHVISATYSHNGDEKYINIEYLEAWVRDNYDGKYHLVKLHNPTPRTSWDNCSFGFAYLGPGEVSPLAYRIFTKGQWCPDCEVTDSILDTEPEIAIRQLVYSTKPYITNKSIDPRREIPTQYFRYMYVDDLFFYRFEVEEKYFPDIYARMRPIIVFYDQRGKMVNVVQDNYPYIQKEYSPGVRLYLGGGDYESIDYPGEIIPYGAACTAVPFDRRMKDNIDRIELTAYMGGYY
jgi:hypothetical protein